VKELADDNRNTRKRDKINEKFIDINF